jgi:hypothetical protein
VLALGVALATLCCGRRALADDSVILLGVHTEPIEGYTPMFSNEGKPRTIVGPGYRTLVLRVQDGNVTLDAELPYIALPQRAGFRYLGESSVSLHEPPSPPPSDPAQPEAAPNDYDATELWAASRRTDIPALAKRLEQHLLHEKRAGVEHTEQLVYVTPKAMCRFVTDTEWTGGATWFNGETHMPLTTPQGATLKMPLARVAPPDLLGQFMKAALEGRDSEGAKLEEPFDAGWGKIVDFRTETGVCLEHRAGRAWVDGTVDLPGNSARSYTFSAPVMPAPASLVGTSDATAESVAFSDVQRRWPAALDFVSSYHGDALVLQTASGFVAVNAHTDVAGPTFPVTGRLVMVETAAGPAAARWLAVLTAP